MHMQTRPLPVTAVQVVVAKGDGSFYWEELAVGVNRALDVAGEPLAVTCHMGGDTDVSAGGSGASAAAPAPAASSAAEPVASSDPPSAIDMSVDMDAAQELNPAFNMQVRVV